MAPRAAPLRAVVLHRGEPWTNMRDPWSVAGGDRIVALARAIASSPGWSQRPAATILVRGGTEPLILALGRFQDVDLAWMEAARSQVEQIAPRLCWFDPASAEAVVEELAEALTARYGRSGMLSWQFAAVPRGGLFVLASLAYLLDLAPDSLATTSDSLPRRDDGPLVVVDDVALSGLRLSQHIERLSADQIIVATLHAHPELRRTFLSAHPRVIDFVNAIDLDDHAPAELGAGYAAWHRRWRARLNPSSLWIGQPDHVAYPWNEPDVSVWNPVAEREEHGWPLVPPEACLKGRGRRAVPIQQIAAPVPPPGPDTNVVAAEVDDRVVLMLLEQGEVVELDEIASHLWRALVTFRAPRDAGEHVANLYDVDVARARADAEAFLRDLIDAGLWRGGTVT